MIELPRDLLSVSKSIDFDAILRYADLTNDYNPLHVDRDFAANSPMKGIIAHGTMSLNLIWQALRATLGNEAVQRATLDIRFVRPVRECDTVTGGGRLSETAKNTYDVWVRNQNGEPVIQGLVTLRDSDA